MLEFDVEQRVAGIREHILLAVGLHLFLEFDAKATARWLLLFYAIFKMAYLIEVI